MTHVEESGLRRYRRPMASDAFVGKQIRIARLEAGLSQTELGTMVGVTFHQIQKYERGANRVAIGRLLLIARALGKPAEFFFDEYERIADSAVLTSSQAFVAHPFARNIIDAWLLLPEEKRQAFRDAIVGIAKVVNSDAQA
jgi:transcriptional regulator with XRE-family HTH domain